MTANEWVTILGAFFAGLCTLVPVVASAVLRIRAAERATEAAVGALETPEAEERAKAAADANGGRAALDRATKRHKGTL